MSGLDHEGNVECPEWVSNKFTFKRLGRYVSIFVVRFIVVFSTLMMASLLWSFYVAGIL